MKQFKSFSIAMLCAAGLFSAGCNNTKETQINTQTDQGSMKTDAYYTGPELDALSSNPNRLVLIETKLGKIKVQLFDKVAPKHVANFTKLVSEGFYNGITFHRIIPGFMVQAGDPNSKDDDLTNDGFGDPSLTKIPAEFSKLKHERGILSAARTNDPNSASSQFFLMHKYSPHLDGQYSIFGQVIEGMDVVDKIVALPKLHGDNPGKAAEMTNVTMIEG